MAQPFAALRRGRRGVVAAALAFGITAAPAASLALAPVAQAHDAVVGGSPADGDVVQEFPSTLTLDFSGEVQDGFNTFALSRSDTGEVLFTGEPRVDGREVSIDVPADIAPEPGEYRIGFQIVSSDGHATKGMSTFTYAPAAAAEGQEAQTAAATQPGDAGAEGESSDTTAETQAENNEQENNSGPNTVLVWVAAGALLIGGVAAVAVARNRQSRTLTDTGENAN